MSRTKFATKLKNHDWYYAYSDDHRVWKAGHAEQSALTSILKELDCPYSLAKLRKWAHKMIVEEFAEELPGEWYRQPRKYKSIAPTQIEELITQSEWDIIQTWFDNG